MAIIKIDAFKCDRCNWIWISHIYNAKDDLPLNCSRCKTSHWNRGKKDMINKK